MSLLSSDRVEVFLGPRGIRLARRPRGLRKQAVDAHALACPAGPDSDWRGAVDALRRALEALDWARADAAVTLSNHFVRFALVPPVPGMKRGHRRAVAEHQMRVVYGDAADSWRVAVDDAPADASAVAGAVDPAMVEGIEAVLRAVGLRPVALRPYLAEAYDACRRNMNGSPAWLAVGEPGRVCVASVHSGRWLALRSQRISGALRDELHPILEQARLSASIDAPAGTVYLVSRDEPPFTLPEDAGWSVRPITWTQ